MAAKSKGKKARKTGYHRRTPQQQIQDLEARIAELQERIDATDAFDPAEIKAERDRLDLSAKDYAALVGVSPLTIYAWERGKSTPRASAMEKLLAVKGIARAKAYKRLRIEDTAKDMAKFSADAVRSERDRLELTAAEYAELIGISPLTVYSWEHGRTKPRPAQLERWLAVKGIKKQDAWDELGYEEVSEFSPEAVLAERERLELSARDYGELVGVSMITIYNWEKGKSVPRAKQIDKWLAVKGIGKRAAWGRVGV